MMDTTTILSIITGFLSVGVVGDIVMRIIFRSERQKASAEAQAREDQMWHDRLAEQREATKDLNEAQAMLTESNKRLAEENADKTRYIRKLQDEKNNLLLRIGSLERFIAWLKLWHCAREYNDGAEGCMRRKPQQPFPMEYLPPKEMGEGQSCEHIDIKEEININVRES